MKKQLQLWAYNLLYRYMCRLMRKRDGIKRRQLKVQKYMERLAQSYKAPATTKPTQVIGL